MQTFETKSITEELQKPFQRDLPSRYLYLTALTAQFVVALPFAL